MDISVMSYAVSPLLYRNVLCLAEITAGLFVSCQSVLTVLASMLGGRLADFYGRKRVSLTMLMMLFVSNCFASVLCRTLYVIPFLLLNSFFSGASYPGITAMLADALRGTGRREGFSLLYLSGNLGISVGPAIAGMLFYNHLPWIFRTQASVVILALAVIFLFTRDSYDPAVARLEKGAPSEDKISGEKGRSVFSVLWERPLLLRFFIALIIMTICYQMVNFVLNLQMADYFGLETASHYAGLLWTVNGLCVVFITPLVSSLFKKIHQYRKMIIGAMFYVVGFGSYAWLKRPSMVLVFVVIWSVGEILISTESGAFIAENSPLSHVARCQALYETSRSLGRAVSNPLFGFLLGYITYKQAWHLNSLLCMLVAVFLFLTYKRLVRGSDREESLREPTRSQ